ncbi:Predicted ATP-dependent endonuclease of the OLD family, contains P-loop ATPase and TOPRIM domains [Fibrobacter sp. UWB16]|uniref:ATP-dependent nuclease n=1 Tax=unclassified Fibrobacter TaxID=2634177 RepID=UPI000B5289FA|nr:MULTISPECIES: AAA family ATPase [unclassified Fibrobacter]MBP5439846.1 AAA family ATPase [Fibrobacter sp.]OWV18187.1 nuclease [Fibrobacter sp. UWB3]SOD17239.1 Predicted ATP-dependent endonuclease of the OLD family, contains P-loop ATPase and TOPRIM domains [Fibrobacter sp. UWB16]
MQPQALRLSRITISNLRSIQRETFPLSDFTALIGYNNAGKTNILMGIRWLLANFSLDISYFDDPNHPVEAEGLFEGITEQVLNRLGEEKAAEVEPFLSGTTLRVKKVQRIPGELPGNIEFWAFCPPNGKRKGKDWVRVNDKFTAAFNRMFPESIAIWDFEGNQAYTKLMHEIFKPLERRFGGELSQVIEQFTELLSPGSDCQAEEIKAFDKEVNSALRPLFPSVRVELDIPVPTLETFLKSATIKVVDEDDGFERDISRMGAGSQRAIQMALIRYLAEIKKHHNNHYLSRKLLLIDSPELFLHPQAVELVRVALKNLSNEGYQVVFATHSAQMVTSEDVSTSLLIRKNRERGTFMRKRMEDAVRQVVKDAPSQLQMLFSLSNSNELLFADYVLLTEGKTEWRVLPALFERITGQSFALIKCALVRQGGVSNTRKSMQVLSAMDIPVRAIVDLDYAFTTATRDGFLSANDPDITECRNLFRELACHNHLRLVNGLPVNKHSNISASTAYAMMASMPEAERPIRNIHNKLCEQGIWVWTRGAIEEHLGLNGKNEMVWRNFIERSKSKNFVQTLPDYDGIEALCQWIINGSRGQF